MGLQTPITKHLYQLQIMTPKQDQGSSGLRKSDNFMDELLLKFTQADAKSNYINKTNVLLCESFFRTVVFLNYHFVAAATMKVSVILLIASHRHS